METLFDFNWYVVIATLLFIAFDFATGFIQAVANKEVKSEKLRQGLFHKCGFVFAIMFGILVEWSLQFVDLGFTVPVATAVCAYICLTEVTSILENLGKLSPELAQTGFMSIFDQHEPNDDNDESEG